MYEPDEWHEAFEVFRPAVQIERRLWSGRLYKYCTNEVADLMLRNGSVCVGNAEYYRRMQNARADHVDSIVSVHETIDSRISPHRLSPMAQQMLSAHHGVIFSDSLSINEYSDVNRLLYCVSYELSRTAADTYDACVEITDPRAFFRELDKGLPLHIRMTRTSGVRVWAVSYLRGRAAPWLAAKNVPPCFFKDLDEFGHEREICAAWDISCEPDAGPLIFNVTSIAPLLRRVDIPSPGMVGQFGETPTAPKDDR